MQTLPCRRRPLGAHDYCHCCVFGGALIRGYSCHGHLGVDGYCKIQDMSRYKRECCPRWGCRPSNTGESHYHVAWGLSQLLCDMNALSTVTGKPESCGRPGNVFKHKLSWWQLPLRSWGHHRKEYQSNLLLIPFFRIALTKPGWKRVCHKWSLDRNI